MKFDPQRSSDQPSNAQSAKIVFSVYNRHSGGNINEKGEGIWVALWTVCCGMRA